MNDENSVEHGEEGVAAVEDGSEGGGESGVDEPTLSPKPRALRLGGDFLPNGCPLVPNNLAK